MNRLKTVINKDSSLTTLSSFTYSLYADGQRKSVTEADGTVIDWTYDNLNRLEKEDYDAPGTSSDYIHDYHYDIVGNRTQFDVDSVPQVYYFYNESDRLDKETSDSSGNNILVSYLYDDNGSLTQSDNGTVTAYTYNLQNRMNSVTVGANPTVTYKYNPDGIRTQKKVGSAEPIDYLIDPFNHTGYAQVLKQTQTGSSDIVFIIGLDVMAQATGTASPVFMLYDGQGSVRQLSDNTGTIISGQNFNYDGYGNLLDSPTTQTDYLYAGEQYDDSLGWYNNRARYYNPANGRFNRTDPFAGFIYEPQSLHKYLYVHNDPTNNTDPMGYFLTRIIYGQKVHKELGLHFIGVQKALDPLSDRTINSILGLKGKERLKLYGLHRPDLVARKSGEVYEIKPATAYLEGKVQLAWYLLLLNSNDPLKRVWRPGKSYVPQRVIDLGPLAKAFVNQPILGVITYQVIDVKPAVYLATAYASARLLSEINLRIQIGMLAPAW